jgi:4,5-DOPA dioxygenase extradiol
MIAGVIRMSAERLPSLFVSHGAPTLIHESVPARAFLAGLGRSFPRVEAILCISAHWNLPAPAVSAVDRPETIHDFYGFPASLYQEEYPARGSPRLAGRVNDLLRQAGITCTVDTTRGLDHGAWVPLKLMYPGAGIPVVQLAIQQHLDPAASLGEGMPTEPWAEEFNDWLTDAVTRGDPDLLVRYRAIAPHVPRAHPYPDHYMPLLVALGAAGAGARGTVLHHSWDLGDLGMDAYSFT